MTPRLLTTGFLLLLAALSAWAAPDPNSSPWGPEIQVTTGTQSAVGVVGRSLAVLPDGTRVIVWVGGGRAGPVMVTRSSDGVRWSAPKTVQGTSFASSPNIGTAPNGTLHLNWGRRQGSSNALWHATSKDAGRTWTRAQQVSPSINRPLRGKTLAVDGKGRVHLAWHQGNPEGNSTRATVHYTRSTDGGRSFEPVQQLGAGLAGHSAFPRMVLSGVGTDVIAVPFRGQTDPPDWDVQVAISRDGGQTFVDQVAVDSRFRDWDPEAWVDASGNTHLAWMTQRGGGRGVTIDYARSEDFGLTWTPPVTLSRHMSRFPNWAPAPDGRSAWLVWKDERDFGSPPCVGRERCADLAGVFTQDGGRSWTAPELFTDLGQVETKFPSVVLDHRGRLHLMWSDRRQATEQIFYQVRQGP